MWLTAPRDASLARLSLVPPLALKKKERGQSEAHQGDMMTVNALTSHLGMKLRTCGDFPHRVCWSVFISLLIHHFISLFQFSVTSHHHLRSASAWFLEFDSVSGKVIVFSMFLSAVCQHLVNQVDTTSGHSSLFLFLFISLCLSTSVSLYLSVSFSLLNDCAPHVGSCSHTHIHTHACSVFADFVWWWKTDWGLAQAV